MKLEQGKGSFNPAALAPCIFAALSEAAEVYFKAIQKIGEQALQSSTSQMLGKDSSTDQLREGGGQF